MAWIAWEMCGVECRCLRRGQRQALQTGLADLRGNREFRCLQENGRCFEQRRLDLHRERVGTALFVDIDGSIPDKVAIHRVENVQANGESGFYGNYFRTRKPGYTNVRCQVGPFRYRRCFIGEESWLLRPAGCPAAGFVSRLREYPRQCRMSGATARPRKLHRSQKT